MAATTPENKVKKQIDKILAPYVKRGVLTYEKTAGSMFGKNGWPDYCGVLLGLFWAIEAKHWPKKPTDLQQPRIDSIKAAGGFVIVVHERNIHLLPEFFRRLEKRALKIQELLRDHS